MFLFCNYSTLTLSVPDRITTSLLFLFFFSLLSIIVESPVSHSVLQIICVFLLLELERYNERDKMLFCVLKEIQ